MAKEFAVRPSTTAPVPTIPTKNSDPTALDKSLKSPQPRTQRSVRSGHRCQQGDLGIADGGVAEFGYGHAKAQAEQAKTPNLSLRILHSHHTFTASESNDARWNSFFYFFSVRTQVPLPYGS